VSNGSTKANSAIVHAGYDAKEVSLKGKYNALGNAMFDKLSEGLDIPFKRCGALVLAFSEEERDHLEGLMEREKINNIPGMKVIEKEEIKKVVVPKVILDKVEGTELKVVVVEGGIYNRLTVKTADAIPKGLIFKCMAEINKVEVNSPVKIGNIIIKIVLDTGVDIVTTRNM